MYESEIVMGNFLMMAHINNVKKVWGHLPVKLIAPQGDFLFSAKRLFSGRSYTRRPALAALSS